MMSTLEPKPLQTDAWQHVEQLLAQLHAAARNESDRAVFYAELLGGCVNLLAASGGVIWQRSQQNHWIALQQIGEAALALGEASHQRLLNESAQGERPCVVTRLTAENDTETSVLLGPVRPPAGQVSADSSPVCLVELWLRGGSSPAVQHGWEEFLAAVCNVAGEFHLHERLRQLETQHYQQADVQGLLTRIYTGGTLAEIAYEIANETRRLLGADRVSLLVQQRGRWRLLAASGVERLESRADAVGRMTQLATVAACWGEVVDYNESCSSEDTAELPPTVATALQQHVDLSHARRLVAVSSELAQEPADEETTPSTVQARAVLIAERFQSGGARFSGDDVARLARLCAPALGHAIEQDVLPVRWAMRWSRWWNRLWHQRESQRRAWLILAGIIALLGLALVPSDFEIEVPATLVSLVEQNVFATADGTVHEVRVEHGDRVRAGEVLAVLDDPAWALENERVLGEISAVRKRREAIAVARTDRRVREELTGDRLPLAAEDRQLQLRLTSLGEQLAILRRREEALVLRSPLAGTVLTMDVQNLLRTRPVERGQVLFTVADEGGGWKLRGRVPQSQVGYLFAAQQDGQVLPVRFKLAGDAQSVYTGRITNVAQQMLLDEQGQEELLPEVPVDIAVESEPLPAARSGMAARVRVDCGRRSLAFIWLHDVWNNVAAWLAF
jgi:multidrug efflux pump subunit AcrA (membrane-fusion protein)